MLDAWVTPKKNFDRSKDDLLRVAPNDPGNQVPVRLMPAADDGDPRWGAMLRPVRTKTAR